MFVQRIEALCCNALHCFLLLNDLNVITIALHKRSTLPRVLE